MVTLGQSLKDLLARWTFALPSAEANLEALRLLKDNLSPGQRHQLELFNYFDVVGGDTGAYYRVHFDRQMNVEQLETSGKSIAWFCFIAEGQLPVADTVLAQKMALELFETEALRVAPRMPPSPGAQSPIRISVLRSLSKAPFQASSFGTPW
jgi:hypothetical protein